MQLAIIILGKAGESSGRIDATTAPDPAATITAVMGSAGKLDTDVISCGVRVNLSMSFQSWGFYVNNITARHMKIATAQQIQKPTSATMSVEFNVGAKR